MAAGRQGPPRAWARRLPADGKAYLDLLDADARAREERRVAERGEGWRWPVPSWSEMEEGGTSLAGLGNPARRTLPTLGVMCSLPLAQVRELIAAGHPWFRELADPQWRLAELRTGHWPMLSVPDQLAKLLLDESTPR